MICTPLPPVSPIDWMVACEFSRTGVSSRTLISTWTLRASCGSSAKDCTSPTLMPLKPTLEPVVSPATELSKTM